MPALEQVLTKESDHRRIGPGALSLRLRLVAAVVLIAALSFPIYMHFQTQNVTPAPTVAADLSQWESPTDFLLTFSGEPPWRSLPTVETAVPDWIEQEDMERHRE